MDAIVYITYIAIILIVGLICSFISKKLKIPNILLLIIAGMLLQHVNYEGSPLMVFPTTFLSTISIFALAMIVFDASSRLKLKEFDTFSTKALKVSIVFLLLNIIFLTVSTMLIFNIKSIPLALIFATLMSGTAVSAVLIMLKGKANKVCEMLKIESIVNTPFIVLIPFIILDIMGRTVLAPKVSVSTILIDQIGPFLLQFIAGIGTGILIGLVTTKFFKKKYSKTLSPLGLMATVLLAYGLAEMLKGNGVLSVTIFGLFFGNTFIKEKTQLHEFSSTFADFLEIFIFVLIGLVLTIPLEKWFLINAGILFLIYLCIRFIAISISFKKHEFSFKEKIFMSLNVQKGIGVATVAISLISYKLTHIAIISGIEKTASMPFTDLLGAREILNLILAFMLFSIILSTIVMKFSNYFLKREKDDMARASGNW